MKLILLALTAIAQNTNVTPKFPQRRLYEIRKQVNWISDTHLNCSAKGIQAATIKKRMNGLLDRIEKKYTQCWESTPGLAPAKWVNPSEKPETVENRRKRDDDDNNHESVRLNNLSAEAAIQQLGRGLLGKWMASHSEKYPCNFAKDGQAEIFAANFDRWANRKMMTRLMKCNTMHATPP